MRFIATFILNCFLTLFSFVAVSKAGAQCVLTISTFPYNEGFESGQGNWVPSNTAHWEWGTPSKTIITAAGSGSRCWIAGGVANSFYYSGRSELTSPCFNFSALVNPEISFKIFWETELKFDGATFEFSADGGQNWSVLGSANSNSNCAGIENWFTFTPINFLNNSPGWSGNIQSGSGQCQTGGGSGGWITARHSLSSLAGRDNIRFRFSFGAGTICNEFDGLAIDDIKIAEAPPSAIGAFAFTCGANNTAQFTNSTLPCQVGWNWNFGDPASGDNNFSTIENPVHIFSTGGTYVVSLTIQYASGNSVVVPPQTVVIPNVVSTITNIKCNGDENGSVSLNISPPAAYSYSWNTTPMQTGSSISDLKANIPYTVTITSTNTCNVSIPFILTQPDELTINPTLSNAKCGNSNGAIITTVTGGTAPYFYSWSNGQTGSSITGLSPGSYGVEVQDTNGCVAAPASNLIVDDVENAFSINLGSDRFICPGEKVTLDPGRFASYKWQDNSTASTFVVSTTGVYSVEVTDIDGCKALGSVKITVDCKGVYFPSAFTPGSDPLNSSFGAIGDISFLKNYSLVVYNRYGEVIFVSSDPSKKWDGRYKGKECDTQVFVYTVNYTLEGRKPIFKKGSVLLIR